MELQPFHQTDLVTRKNPEKEMVTLELLHIVEYCCKVQSFTFCVKWLLIQNEKTNNEENQN